MMTSLIFTDSLLFFSKEDVREAGKKGLILPESSDKGVNTAPAFPAIVEYIHIRAGLLLKSDSCYTTAVGKLPFAPVIMTEALKFLWLCLEASAGVSEGDRHGNTALVPVASYLTCLGTADSATAPCVSQYLDLVLQSLEPAGGINSVGFSGQLYCPIGHLYCPIGQLYCTVSLSCSPRPGAPFGGHVRATGVGGCSLFFPLSSTAPQTPVDQG